MSGEVIKMLVENTDSNGEAIINMQPPKALLKADTGSYVSYFTNTFSISSSIQQKIDLSLDLPKWNEITLMAQIAESVTSKSGVKVLRSADVFLTITKNTDWDVMLSDNPKALERIKTLLKQYSDETTYTTKSYELLRHMNASLFFTLLFVNTEFNDHLNIDEKLILGNALSFATWKEQMEHDISLHPEMEGLEYGYTRETFQQSFFNDFCSGNKNLIEILEDRKELSQLLCISPWCGFEKVWNYCIIRKSKPFINKWGKRNKVLSDILAALSHDKSDGSLEGIYSFLTTQAKRKQECQWFLLETLKILSPLTSPQLKTLVHEIQQLAHANIAIDTQLYSEEGINLIESIQKNPRFLKEINSMNEEFKEYVSSTMAGIVSKTGEKLLQKSFNYFVVLPFAIQIIRTWRKYGLFASMHYIMQSTVKSLVSHGLRVMG